MPKRTKTTCNICLDQPSELKCHECTYETCYNCIYEWSARSHNCPLCGRFETYDIDYPLLDSEEESIYDYEVYDPQYADPFLYGNYEEEDEDEWTENENDDEYDENDDEYDEFEYNQHPQPVPLPLFDPDFGSFFDQVPNEDEEYIDEHPNYNYYALNQILELSPHELEELSLLPPPPPPTSPPTSPPPLSPPPPSRLRRYENS